MAHLVSTVTNAVRTCVVFPANQALSPWSRFPFSRAAAETKSNRPIRVKTGLTRYLGSHFSQDSVNCELCCNFSSFFVRLAPFGLVLFSRLVRLVFLIEFTSLVLCFHTVSRVLWDLPSLQYEKCHQTPLESQWSWRQVYYAKLVIWKLVHTGCWLITGN